MRFYVPCNNVNSLFLALVPRLEHGVGLAHARGIAQEYLQPAAAGPLGLDILKQFIWIGTGAHRIYCNANEIAGVTSVSRGGSCRSTNAAARPTPGLAPAH